MHAQPGPAEHLDLDAHARLLQPAGTGQAVQQQRVPLEEGQVPAVPAEKTSGDQLNEVRIRHGPHPRHLRREDDLVLGRDLHQPLDVAAVRLVEVEERLQVHDPLQSRLERNHAGSDLQRRRFLLPHRRQNEHRNGHEIARRHGPRWSLEGHNYRDGQAPVTHEQNQSRGARKGIGRQNPLDSARLLRAQPDREAVGLGEAEMAKATRDQSRSRECRRGMDARSDHEHLRRSRRDPPSYRAIVYVALPSASTGHRRERGQASSSRSSLTSQAKNNQRLKFEFPLIDSSFHLLLPSISRFVLDSKLS